MLFAWGVIASCLWWGQRNAAWALKSKDTGQNTWINSILDPGRAALQCDMNLTVEFTSVHAFREFFCPTRNTTFISGEQQSFLHISYMYRMDKGACTQRVHPEWVIRKVK